MADCVNCSTVGVKQVDPGNTANKGKIPSLILMNRTSTVHKYFNEQYETSFSNCD